uniref:Uncharacterized protein n=1 Tax=Noccaea caerulescens TaxID=107243 RepID=A0A1J3KAJ1_NOCCA
MNSINVMSVFSRNNTFCRPNTSFAILETRSKRCKTGLLQVVFGGFSIREINFETPENLGGEVVKVFDHTIS